MTGAVIMVNYCTKGEEKYKKGGCHSGVVLLLNFSIGSSWIADELTTQGYEFVTERRFCLTN